MATDIIPSPPVLHKEFLGLRSSIINPPSNSAKACNNLVRHKHGGILELAPGYAPTFGDEGGFTDLPQIDSNLFPNYLDPFFHKISNLVLHEDIHNFFVPDHGGKVIRVVVGTYRKTSQYDETVYIDRMGIWIRPWYDPIQAKWSDDETFFFDNAQTHWQELTECQILQVTDFGVPVNRIKFAPVGFPRDYFKNWVGVFSDYSQGSDADNYISVIASDLDESDPMSGEPLYIDYFGKNSSLARNVGDKLILNRSWYNKELPSSLTSQIFDLLNEIRLTTGNEDKDLAIMAGFKSKTFGFLNGKKLDTFISEQSMFDTWRYAWGADAPAVTTEITDPVPIGKYAFGYTLHTEDGQETEMRKLFDSDTSKLVADLWASSRPNIMTTDGNFIYAVTNNGDDREYIKFQKLSIVDLSVLGEVTSTLPALAPRDVHPCHGIAIDGTIAYVSLNSFLVMRIDTVTMTVMHHVIGGASSYGGKIVVNGTHIYVANREGKLIRYNKADLTGATTLDLTAVSTNLTDMVSDGTYLYISTGDSTAKIIQVTISTMLQTGASPLVLSLNKAYAMCIQGAKLFVSMVTSPASVIRVSIPALAEDGAPSPYIAAAGNDYATAIVSDGTYLYVVVDDGLLTVPDPFVPLKIINGLDPVTMTATSIFSFTNGTADGHSGSDVRNLFILTLLNIGNYLYLNGTLLNKINKFPNTSLTVDGTTKITLALLLSPSTIPQRTDSMRIYVDTADDGDFTGVYNLVKEAMIIKDGGVTWDPEALFHPIAKHFYARGLIDLFGLDFNNPGAEISANIGRSSTDKGICRYKYGDVVPSKTYLVGTIQNGHDRRNQILFCATHGDGTIQYDVFPDNALQRIDLERGDGDELKAVAQTNARLVAIKGFSIILLTQRRDGGYDPTVISAGFGISSVRTIVEFNQYVFCLDYNGVVQFNYLGLQVINQAWRRDLIEMSDSVKENAIAVFDRKNLQYRLLLGTQQYVYDIEDGEWLIQEKAITPIRFAENPDKSGGIDFIGETMITVDDEPILITKHETFDDGLSLDDGEPVDWEFERNQQRPSVENPKIAMNVLLGTVEHETSVPMTLEILKNNSSEVMETKTFDVALTGEKRQRTRDLKCKCSSYRARLSGTVTEEGQKVKIIRWGEVFEQFPAGGSDLELP